MKEQKIQLGDDSNLWRKIVIISASREINYEDMIRKHELSMTPRSFMDAKRNMHDRGQGKSKLVEVIKAVNPKISTTKCPDDVHCVVYDGFCMLRHINISKLGIKTGKDLAEAVSNWI